MPYLEIVFVLLLIACNGLLAMSELALVTARRSRLDQLAGEGRLGARAALRLIDDPSGFLATVQIGITLVGILAGAIGGATLGDRLGDWLDTFPALAPHGDRIGIGVVVIAITYLSLIAGELVPKRIALANPEAVAAGIARPMRLLSIAAAPGVWLLRASTEAVLRILGLSGVRSQTVTEDEVKSLIAEGTRAGVFVPQERRMIEGVLRLADRPVRVVMTPRAEVAWIDAAADQDMIRKALEKNRFSRLLVCEQSIDNAVGMLSIKDVMVQLLRGDPLSVRALLAPVLVVPDRTSVLQLLDRSGGVTMPPEITILMASSTVMLSGIMSLLGTNNRKPEVGLGVVGRKMLTTSSSVRFCTSPSVRPVMKAMAHRPRRGYSTSTAWRNAADCWARIVSMICLIAL
jgi:putative hemolysin